MTLNNVEDRQQVSSNDAKFESKSIIKFRSPSAIDGYAITALIKHSPPLDNNSSYCNLLQCTHFSETCVVAESDNRIVGWMSAYRPPEQASRLFIWQMAVHPDARGLGLANRMLTALLARASLNDVHYLNTTITDDNKASWAVFKRFANTHRLNLKQSPFFEKETHFQNEHDTEFLVEIGPFEVQDVIKNQGTQHD